MIIEDPAAVIGVDENNAVAAVPVLEGEDAALSAHQTNVEGQVARARVNDTNNLAKMKWMLTMTIAQWLFWMG